MVSDKKEGAEPGHEAGVTIDPAAISLALSGASREKADAFLDDQRALIAAQLDLTSSEKSKLARMRTHV